MNKLPRNYSPWKIPSTIWVVPTRNEPNLSSKIRLHLDFNYAKWLKYVLMLRDDHSDYKGVLFENDRA